MTIFTVLFVAIDLIFVVCVAFPLNYVLMIHSLDQGPGILLILYYGATLSENLDFIVN